MSHPTDPGLTARDPAASDLALARPARAELPRGDTSDRAEPPQGGGVNPAVVVAMDQILRKNADLYRRLAE